MTLWPSLQAIDDYRTFNSFNLACSVGSSRCSFDLAINVENLSILPNVKRPALSDGSTFMYHAVRLGDLLSWVAEDGIIDTKRFSESFVVFRSICAGGKVGDIGVLESFAILTE
jgi:hypothetical protein